MPSAEHLLPLPSGFTFEDIGGGATDTIKRMGVMSWFARGIECVLPGVRKTRLDLRDEDLRQISAKPSATRRTLDAMYHSEFVISKSSGFPGLFRGFGKFDLLNGERRVSMDEKINLRNLAT